MNDLRALVVDDSKVGRLTMLKKLEAMGVKVDLTESGRQALDYLVQNQPDVIFMDHMMPDMDGFEVTRRIKAAPATRHIPVVIVSGNDDEDFIQQARAAGAIDAIAKPPGAGILESLLGSLPERVAGAMASAVAETAPQPAALEPVPAPSLDLAAVHELVERQLRGAVEHLHVALTADMGKRMEAEFENQRENQRMTLREYSERWREQLDQSAAGISESVTASINKTITVDLAELKTGAVDAETLQGQLSAIEQRLLPLESAASRPLPDLDAVREGMERRLASGLAELQAGRERQEPKWESLRQEWLTWAGEGGGRFTKIETELGELREHSSESRLRQFVADSVGSLLPPAPVVPDIGEREAQQPADSGNGPLQAELDQLKTKVKALTITVAIAGGLLLAALGWLMLRG